MRLFTVWLSRLVVAPRVDLWAFTSLIAASIKPIVTIAFPFAVVAASPVTCSAAVLPSAVAVASAMTIAKLFPSVCVRPRDSAVVDPIFIEIWFCVPVPEPTWNEKAALVSTTPAAPSSKVVPAQVVACEIRSISLIIAFISVCRLRRSWLLLVSFADCTAISRIRCSTFSISLCEPSAVSNNAWASNALRTLWLVPRISADKREEIATPAASSDAELIRFPVDSLSIEASIPLAAMLAAWEARIAPSLVPIDKDIWHNSVLRSIYAKQHKRNEQNVKI